MDSDQTGPQFVPVFEFYPPSQKWKENYLPQTFLRQQLIMKL